MFLRENARIVDALNIGGVRPERERVEALRIAAGHAYHDGAAPIFQRGDAARQVAAGNAVDREIHALATCLGLVEETTPSLTDTAGALVPRRFYGRATR